MSYSNNNDKLTEPKILECNKTKRYRAKPDSSKKNDAWHFTAYWLGKLYVDTIEKIPIRLVKMTDNACIFKEDGRTEKMGIDRTYIRPRYLVGNFRKETHEFYDWYEIQYDKATAKEAKEIAFDKLNIL